ncbi:MAG: hypothetical protein LBD58_07375 [Treponema sp.]|jgi:hypothetical protein|nr:hypothetical protein [Treponema sp.]
MGRRPAPLFKAFFITWSKENVCMVVGGGGGLCAHVNMSDAINGLSGDPVDCLTNLAISR